MDFPSFSQPLTNTIARVAARPRSESFSLRHDEGAARARRIKSEMVSASITIRCSVTHKSQPDVPRWLVWSSYITLRSRESDLLDVDLRHSRRGVTDNLFLGPQTPRAVKFKTLFCEANTPKTEKRERKLPFMSIVPARRALFLLRFDCVCQCQRPQSMFCNLAVATWFSGLSALSSPSC